MQPRDVTGQRFGMLVAESIDASRDGRYWVCRCDCGRVKSVRQNHLTGGLVTSCRCKRRTEEGRKAWVKHDDISSREYRIWMLMRQRCNNPKSTSYPWYGARGIQVCERWDSYAAFLDDVGRAPSSEHQLDRIDNNGHYEPGNVRWTVKVTQARNMRSNRLIEIDGVTRCLAEWCEIYEIPVSRVHWRLDAGWPIKRAFSKELRNEAV